MNDRSVTDSTARSAPELRGAYAPVNDAPELTAREVALAMEPPYRTVARWLGIWLALHVEGVRRVRSRGRSGLAFRVCPTLVARWRRGELPPTRKAALTEIAAVAPAPASAPAVAA